MSKKPLWAAICRFLEEPYRIFFPLAILCGMLGIGHWLAYAAGWIDRYSGFMHASIQMQTYMICFIAGFLMTAMPRMSASAPASWVETCGLMGLISGILISLSLSNWRVANLLFVAALVWLVLFVIRRVRACHGETKIKPPVEFIWVPIALVHGILGSVLLMAGNSKIAGSWAVISGKSMVQQGFVLAIVLGVGGFLAPRLMGTFKVTKSASSPCCEIKQTQDRKRYQLLHLLFGLVLLSSFFLEGFGLVRIAYGTRAFLITGMMIWTRSLVFKPLMHEQYVRLVWLSFWMVFLGSWSVFFFPEYHVAMLHLVFLGGYSLMTFSVATMVISSHAGRKEKLQRPSKVLTFLAFSVLAATILRVISAFMPDRYFLLLGLSALSWLMGAFIWLLSIGPLIFVFPEWEAISRIHKDAKRAVLKMKGAEVEPSR
ncbi:MAG: NnrS family protein [Desulfobacterales bacterium]|nr:NnrS family protein [Desulfobacterales bacterium]